ncbi:MAG: fimbria/pilus outer membrane usher protein [Holosporales bacterium]|jgi:outer membrane usher protein|nr:fimbria/pilus outer membrane usher protein [Holosporales bacterium]
MSIMLCREFSVWIIRVFYILLILILPTGSEAGPQRSDGKAPVVISSSDPNVLQNEEELLSKVFGARREVKDTLMEFNLLLDGETAGEIMVMVGKTNKVLAKSLREALTDYLTEEQLRKIDTAKDENGFVDFAILNSMNLETKFDKIRLRVEINAPISAKKKRDIAIGSKIKKEKPNVYPALVSACTNVRFSQSFYGNEKTHPSHKTLLLTPFLNVAGVVLESEYSYEQEGSKKGPFKRGRTALVYDWAEEALLFQAGDVSGHSVDYCGSPSVSGVSVYKDAARSGGESMTQNIPVSLLRESTIEVYVNNNLITTKPKVAPGTYMLNDIPCTYGFNDVKIKIIDDTGREAFLKIDTFFDSSFVQKGQCSYGIIFGRSQASSKKNMLASGFLKFGLPFAMEGSLGFSVNKIGRTLSLGTKHKNRFGLFEGRIAHSQYKEIPLQAKGKIFSCAYSSPSLTLLTIPIGFNLFYEHADPFFYSYLDTLTGLVKDAGGSNLSLDTFEKAGKEGGRSSFRSSLSFSNIFQMNVGISCGVEKNQEGTQKRFSLNISRSFQMNNAFLNNLSISGSFERLTFPGRSETIFAIYGSVPLKIGANVSHQWQNKNGTSTSLSYQPSDGGFSGNASFSRNKGAYSYTGSAHYRHARFSANINRSGSKGSSYATTQVGIETGIVFADGAFAVTQNGANDGGFLIVRTAGALARESVKFLNSSAQSGWLGGAVLSTGRDVSSYRIDLESLPNNLEVTKDTIIAKGSYKRGTVAEISAEGSYIAQGNLLDTKRKPIALAGGFALSKTKKGGSPLLFFTNDDGRFVIAGLNPGKYKVTINVEGYADFEITIPESSAPFIDLGTIVCKDTP